MKLVNMKNTAEQKQEVACSPCDNQPKYPWGLELRLETESLKKLGIKKMPKVGDEVEVRAMATVTSISEHESEHGANRSLGLQITDLGLGKDRTDADVLYDEE